MAENHKPHPQNVPGDFYVENGCCTMCGVPFQEAPELFDAADDPEGYQHCFVKRQPANALEVDQMIMTIRCAELQCVRYGGNDRGIVSRLVELGEGLDCDALPPESKQRFEELDSAGNQHRLPPPPAITKSVHQVLLARIESWLRWRVR